MVRPTGTWRILDTRERWPHFRYHIIDPDGRLETLAWTRWGARWAIRRAKKGRVVRDWWNAPVIHEEGP